MSDSSSTSGAGDYPFDLDFFWDPGCPFAWQTSRWIHQVIEQTGLRVNWRFISLYVINDRIGFSSDDYKANAIAGRRFHRVAAAVRAKEGTDKIGDLYTSWGERLWNATPAEAEAAGGFFRLGQTLDIAAILAENGLSADYLAEAENDAWDATLEEETDLAFSRTGDDVGTPILTFAPPDGNSYFGPVISSLPETGEEAVKIYEALKVLVDFETFSEIKRTKRPPLDLPVFGG